MPAQNGPKLQQGSPSRADEGITNGSGSCGQLRFGVFEMDLRSGELTKRGLRVRLQRQPFKVLARLASRNGELVDREELKAALWNGETFVDFDQGLNFCIKQIRYALGDDAQTPRFVETLPRRGYRFLAPVQQAEEPPRPAAAPSAPLSPPPDRSIAVLPFADMSPEKDQDYFCEGIAEEILNALRRVAHLQVASRSSSFRLRSAGLDAREIGRRLGVATLLDGSVRKSGDRLRITVELVDVARRLPALVRALRPRGPGRLRHPGGDRAHRRPGPRGQPLSAGERSPRQARHARDSRLRVLPPRLASTSTSTTGGASSSPSTCSRRPSAGPFATPRATRGSPTAAPTSS